MDITPVSGLESLNSLYKTVPQKPGIDPEQGPPKKDFGTVFDAAVNLVDETNTLQNKASAESIKFSLGLSDNAHDVMIASQKASIALQYTNAIRTTFMQSYQTIMNMQI
ncbi:MAG: flagellar hook-basal body complex protein FliE [Lachnospiraceae bacterium]|nr:flagellar hook-basal body complex protein FliE [Lachnospiraceae bacterium]